MTKAEVTEADRRTRERDRIRVLLAEEASMRAAKAVEDKDEAIAKIRKYVAEAGNGFEEAAIAHGGSLSVRTHNEERALVCWQILDEIDAIVGGGAPKKKERDHEQP